MNGAERQALRVAISERRRESAGHGKTGWHKVDLVTDLSPREVEFLQDAADGFSNCELAERLGVTTETAKSHMRNVIAKLGAKNRTHAVTLALRAGTIH